MIGSKIMLKSSTHSTSKEGAIDQDKVLIELAKMLFKASPLSIWGTYMGIGFVYLVLQPVAETSELLIWTLSFTAMNTGRLVHSIYRFRHKNSLNYKVWVTEFSVIAFIAACFWGSASIYLFPVGEPIYQLMLAFVLVTTSAIAITNISMILYVILPYIVITLTPLIIRFAISEHEAMSVSAIMVSLSMLLLLGGAYRSHKNIYETISLRIQEQNNAQKLKASQSRLSLHVQQTPLAVIEMDTNMTITQWNESAEMIFGYRHSEAIGRNISELLVPENARKKVDLIVENLASQNGGTHNINNNITKSGTTILCEWFNTPLVDEYGVVVGFASLAQDITERSRIEKMKDEFISIVSHELRTPLTSLRGSLGLVIGGMTGEIPDKAKEFLSMAEKNAERLTLLINDILDIQAIKSGQLSFDMHNIELADILQTAIDENMNFAKQSAISIKLSDINQALPVHVDASRIQQVLDNLISNAIKFSPDNDVITVSTTVKDKQVVVSVCDNGPGVTEAFQPSLFDKFTQGEESSTRNFSGSGLGLSIAKGIIEQHGGSITYQRSASGGSCFSFKLALFEQ
ncbi:MAG: ATP-binding protein [Gammaproteobacteria bacterium]|nr:ATP-binding protein [Gammaproteobacteria bacterium]